MKKTMKTLGMVAASAALALGCAMPAFAVDAQNAAVTGADKAFDANRNGETVVSVFYNPDQISATIPMTMTIVATGGTTASPEAIIAPTSDAYAITNNSTTASIAVENVKATPEDNWMLYTTGGAPNFSGNNASLKGGLDLSLAAVKGAGEAATTSGALVLANIQNTATAPDAADASFWTAGAGEKINLAVSGQSVLNTTVTGSTADDLGEAVTITYTVKKA